MRNHRVFFTLGCTLIGLAALAKGQSKQQPGLWETTSSMTMGGAGMPAAPQMPSNVQLPPGVQMPAGAQMSQGGPMGGPHTTQVCVTQEMIDKYGGPYSNPPRGDCQVTNVSLKADGMTANVACTGQMNATGTVESTFTDGNSAQTKIHLAGTMQMGPNSRPVDITMQSKSVYKGPDCGGVKPLAMPAAK